jgi:16S rRNA (cytosine967-C5)-methyltransferase
MSVNLRLIAARVIDQVTEGFSLTDVLEKALSSLKEARDRAFVQAVCYGVCRFYARLDVIAGELLKKPMNAKDSDVHALIMVGLFQLIEMRVATHAAVAETVNAAKALKKPWAQGLVNAVLREYLRRQEEITQKITSDEEAQYAHSAWWISAIKKAWPTQWQDILNSNNEHPPFALRVNQKHNTPEKYITRLHAAGLQATAIPETSHGIILSSPVTTDHLPGFLAGDVSVQDGAAQLAAELLDLQKGLRVLDACAAPGGKLMHILEIEPDLSAVVAVEKDAERMDVIKENLARIQASAQCICADAAKTAKWWDEQAFDRILLDAPCSASGVIRRHPDIKLLRFPADIKAFAQTQLALLQALWPLLKTGGLFLYATCSIFPDENVNVIKQFLENHSDAHEEKLNVNWGLPCDIGRQILPGMHNMDGFYYARLRKA